MTEQYPNKAADENNNNSNGSSLPDKVDSNTELKQEPPQEEANNEANFEKLPENTDPNIDTITVDSVCKTYKGRTVVNHVSLNIKKGEIVVAYEVEPSNEVLGFCICVEELKNDRIMKNIFLNGLFFVLLQKFTNI